MRRFLNILGKIVLYSATAIVGLFILAIVLFVISESRTSTKPASVVATATQSKQIILVASPTPVPTNTPASTPTPSPIPTATSTFEEMKNKSATILYRDLLRNTEQYQGNLVTYYGKITQVVSEDNGLFELHVAVTKGAYNSWQDNLNVTCRSGIRLLSGDFISFVGTVDGRDTYTTITGMEVTIPKVYALNIEIYPQ